MKGSSEQPLYLLLGAVCGLVSVGLTKSTSFILFDGVERGAGIPKAVFPILGGLTVGCIALVYPEILHWDFRMLILCWNLDLLQRAFLLICWFSWWLSN